MGKITLGKLITLRRKELGMTQRQLAAKMYGLKDAPKSKVMFISAIERDKASVPGPLIKRTAEALELPVETVIAYKVDAYQLRLEKLTAKSK